MAKFRKKIENVDAVQVHFGKGSWPEWLEGNLHTGSTADAETIASGDYLIRDGGSVYLLSESAFEAEFESARAPKVILGITESEDQTSRK